MYYQVYGVLGLSGHNVLIGATKSKKKAYELVKDMNDMIYPYFAITERERKYSIVLGADTGRTREGFATVSTMLVTPTQENNFINDAVTGASFWQKRFGNKEQ